MGAIKKKLSDIADKKRAKAERKRMKKWKIKVTTLQLMKRYGKICAKCNARFPYDEKWSVCPDCQQDFA